MKDLLPPWWTGLPEQCINLVGHVSEADGHVVILKRKGWNVSEDYDRWLNSQVGKDGWSVITIFADHTCYHIYTIEDLDTALVFKLKYS
jgi:hypothetical protein